MVVVQGHDRQITSWKKTFYTTGGRKATERICETCLSNPRESYSLDQEAK